jgi:hypothetical protein
VNFEPEPDDIDEEEDWWPEDIPDLELPELI